MGSTPIATRFLIGSLTVVILLEMAAGLADRYADIPRLWLIITTRTVQVLVLASLANRQPAGLATIGLGRDALLPGLMKGLIGSAGFAVAAGLLLIALWVAGQHPLQLIRSPLPESPYQRALFFMAGGVIAPVAEEIVFRGVIYGYLRRWGKATAVLISTALFAALHVGPALPVTQIIGGLVFAIAYEASGSLIAPIVIHGLGNLAIFTLSMH